jgi:hypothetical protein
MTKSTVEWLLYCIVSYLKMFFSWLSEYLERVADIEERREGPLLTYRARDDEQIYCGKALICRTVSHSISLPGYQSLIKEV